MIPVLWQFTTSHYNEKARWALDFKGVAHVRHTVLPGMHVWPIRRLTGQTAVPVLVLGGRAIHDSTRIIAALEAAYPDPPLYPAGEAARRHALELEELFDEELGPHVRRVIFHYLLPQPSTIPAAFAQENGPLARAALRASFPLLRAVMRRTLRIDEAGAELGRRKIRTALDRIARELGPSDYLVGDRFSVADLTAAALLSPLVEPPEFPYRLYDHVPESMAQFRESVASHPAFGWVLETYRRHRGQSAAIERDRAKAEASVETPR
jgi:glutathione S-transferase